MTDFNETFINPTEAKSGASALTSASDGLYSKWSSLTATIRSLNDSKPWGTDEVGEEFDKNYTKGEGLAGKALDGGDKVVNVMRALGPGVTAVADGTTEADDVIASWYGGSGQGASAT